MNNRTVLGIDLASKPKNTALAVLEEHSDRWEARPVDGLGDDDTIIDIAKRSTVVSIDCPLGWPTKFIEALANHEQFRPWPDLERDEVLWRATDRHVKKTTGITPLRVTADKLGFVATRAAQLQGRLGMEAWDGPAPRDGSKMLVEAYPAAALKVWGLSHNGYKNPANGERRHQILTGLKSALRWVDLDKVDKACVASDHVLDAVISAIIGALVLRGEVDEVKEPGLAASEGWIHLPLGK